MGDDDGSEFWRNANYHVGVSLNGGTPISHPKMMIFFFVGKPVLVVGETHHFRKPPYRGWNTTHGIHGLFHEPINKDPYEPTRISWNVTQEGAPPSYKVVITPANPI